MNNNTLHHQSNYTTETKAAKAMKSKGNKLNSFTCQVISFNFPSAFLVAVAAKEKL